MNITEQAASAVRTIEDVITGAEAVRFRSSMVISLTDGATYEAAVNRAFGSLWSHRLGYATTMSEGSWVDLNLIAERLGARI